MGKKIKDATPRMHEQNKANAFEAEKNAEDKDELKWSQTRDREQKFLSNPKKEKDR